MQAQTTRYDKVVYWLHQLVETSHVWIKALASGFLIGRFTNEASVPGVGFTDAVKATFLLDNRPINFLSIVAILLVVMTFLARPLLSRWRMNRRYDLVFASLVQRHKARAIAPFPGLAWEHSLSLQSSPDLSRGWSISEIRLYHDTKRFSIPERFRLSYQDYLAKCGEEQHFATDSIRLMLTQNPTAFSDNPALTLTTQELLNSQIQFYREVIAPIQSERDSLIRAAVTKSIDFAHTFSMHIVAITNDDKVLITRRSAKVSYFPNTWSCSIEEQLDLEDVKTGSDKSVLHWGTRALSEELGIGIESYNVDNFRVLSVILESDILNIALCAVVKLDISSSVLDGILRGVPRTDYEFTEWTFLEFRCLLDELFQPTREYHPTSGYRMLAASIHRYGEPRIADRFLRRR